MFTTPNGILTSPSYPQKYQNYEDCFYTILRPNGTVIDISITSMDIEWHSTCYYDYLEIRDGGSEQSEVLTKLCGDEIPNPIQSTQNEVWIRWGQCNNYSTCRKWRFKRQIWGFMRSSPSTHLWSSPQVTNPIKSPFKISPSRFYSDISNNGFGFLAEYSSKLASPSDQET